MAKQLAPLGGNVFEGYVGLSDGLPDTEHVTDEYGDSWLTQIFATKTAAKKRYVDVRRVRITIEGIR